MVERISQAVRGAVETIEIEIAAPDEVREFLETHTLTEIVNLLEQETIDFNVTLVGAREGDFAFDLLTTVGGAHHAKHLVTVSVG